LDLLRKNVVNDTNAHSVDNKGRRMSTKYHWSVFLKFLAPSLLGVFLFLAPIEFNGNLTIPIAVVISQLGVLLGDHLLAILIVFCVSTAVLNILYTYVKQKPRWLPQSPFLTDVFTATPFWFWLRVLGALFAVMHYFDWGPRFIVTESVTGVAFDDIGSTMILTFTVACLLMPLLTDYGFMEFIGTIVKPVFRKVFNLPGQAAIDGMASIAAANSVGILITINQYRNGFYTLREASIVATNFSICSIPFNVVIADAAGIEQFFPWFLTGLLSCFVCVLILPRIPPLSTIPTHYSSAGKQLHEDDADDRPILTRALSAAMDRAAHQPGLKGYLKTSGRAVSEVSFGVISASLALVVIAVTIVNETPFFTWITLPLIPILELLQIPEAAAAAPGLLVGYVDQFIPAVLAGQLDSDITKFVLAGLSMAQLIFMTEVGMLILKSEIPLNAWQLLIIFLQRTVIVLPIFTLVAHQLY
jgi:nucleoside recognition membrane protein YjiH